MFLLKRDATATPTRAGTLPSRCPLSQSYSRLPRKPGGTPSSLLRRPQALQVIPPHETMACDPAGSVLVELRRCPSQRVKTVWRQNERAAAPLHQVPVYLTFAEVTSPRRESRRRAPMRNTPRLTLRRPSPCARPISQPDLNVPGEIAYGPAVQTTHCNLSLAWESTACNDLAPLGE